MSFFSVSNFYILSNQFIAILSILKKVFPQQFDWYIWLGGTISQFPNVTIGQWANVLSIWTLGLVQVLVSFCYPMNKRSFSIDYQTRIEMTSKGTKALGPYLTSGTATTWPICAWLFCGVYSFLILSERVLYYVLLCALKSRESKGPEVQEPEFEVNQHSSEIASRTQLSSALTLQPR